MVNRIFFLLKVQANSLSPLVAKEYKRLATCKVYFKTVIVVGIYFSG